MRTEFRPPAIARSCRKCGHPTNGKFLNAEGLCGSCRTQQTYTCKSCGQEKPRDEMLSDSGRLTTRCRECREAHGGYVRRDSYPVPPDPEPARHLGDLLAEARRNGEPFEQAWDDAVEFVLSCQPVALERNQWAVAFRSQRWLWRKGWRREPFPFPTLTLDLLIAEGQDVRPVSEEAA